MLLVAFLLPACDGGAERENELRRLEGKTMGTSWSVVLGDSVPEHLGAKTPSTKSVDSTDRGVDLRGLQRDIERELERLNRLMSTWDPDSELSRFNALQSIEPTSLHKDTFAVIDTARQVSQRTAGRYDITLAKVISLWGYGTERHQDAPEDSLLTQALAGTGQHQLVRSGDTVRKRTPELQLDVSSLAKGFAVDKIGHLLENMGVDHYVAEIGGELRIRGYRQPGVRWQIGVEHPDGSVKSGLSLTDAHVASSGSYRNYREIDGKRLSHIIDGSTGRPIEHSLVAVTVLHDSTMLADAWATALLVVGESRARVLIDSMGLAVQLTSRSDGGFSVFRSPHFEKLLMESKP